MKKLLLVILVLLTALFFCSKSADRKSAIRCVREWARVAPFPKNCTNFEISTTGSMFSRQFSCSFTAPKKSIINWLKRSPGMRNFRDFSKSKYKIKPGGGAQFAEIAIDWTKNKVVINTYWS